MHVLTSGEEEETADKVYAAVVLMVYSTLMVCPTSTSSKSQTQVRSMQLRHLWSILHLRSILHPVPVSVRRRSGCKTEIKSIEYF